MRNWKGINSGNKVDSANGLLRQFEVHNTTIQTIKVSPQHIVYIGFMQQDKINCSPLRYVFYIFLPFTPLITAELTVKDSRWQHAL